MADRLWPYLITRSGHVPDPGLTGVGDLPVRGLDHGGLCIWVSAAADGPAPRDLGSIERHNEVIVAATTPEVTPVPVRYGQITGEAVLCASVAARSSHWLARLDEFAGAAEFGLRVTEREADAARARNMHADPQPGRRFLERLAGRQRRTEAMRAAIGRAVEDLIRREHSETTSEETVIARAAHLVPMVAAESYRNALARLAAEHPDVRFVSSGPWPPYSFAA